MKKFYESLIVTIKEIGLNNLMTASNTDVDDDVNNDGWTGVYPINPKTR